MNPASGWRSGLGGGVLASMLVLAGAWLGLGAASLGVDARRLAAEPPAAPAGALGYPSRAADLDVLPGFRQPPPGYGEVPFWWWTGDPLEKERLLWQIEELHRMGIAGVQVNYAHEDTEGWPTYRAEPEIFSEAWWDVWKFVAGECGKRDMGIGLSGYTLDWPNGRSLVSRTIYSDPDITGRELAVASRTRVKAGTAYVMELPAHAVAVWAYPWADGRPGPAGRALSPGTGPGRVSWTPAEGEWEVWVYTGAPKAGTLDGLHPASGARVIAKFFQQFQDHAAGRASKGLNYFFHDELQFGIGDRAWTGDFGEQFRARKGYDVFEAAPALFADIGPATPKARLDFYQVRMELLQERYFIPIFEWHWSRGLVYGCDQGGRGRDPLEFGDYFSAVRWYTAPGHDTPGGHADLIKGKVSSSIAHLYGRPRVWLEGYHSLGWGAAPERLMQATCENYLYGCNLLNLHGLYYSTHGSFWEWAPPCYHFRMPYWEHMGTFLKYFERLSYLLSQGIHQADIAVLYPVSPGQAGLGGREATELAFEAGTRLFGMGRDFVFMDDESVGRAQVADGRLQVAGAGYRVLVLPGMRAVRWETLRKAQAFRRSGGLVIAAGELPEASDRAGREDAELDSVVRELFGVTAAEARSGRFPGPQVHASGGIGMRLPDGDARWAALGEVLRPIPAAVLGEASVRALHRRVGARDVFLVLGARKGAECVFRATGRVELWDPWTGEARPVAQAAPVPGGTGVRMPLGAPEAQVLVFSPGAPGPAVTATDLDEVERVDWDGERPVVTGYAGRAGRVSAVVEAGGRRAEVTGTSETGEVVPLEGEWEFELRPTMNNRWGDFRLPVVPGAEFIGPEARRFRHAEERVPNPGWERRECDDGGWAMVTGGFGPQFLKLGPVPAEGDPGEIEARLASLGAVDPWVPVEVGGRRLAWDAYAFSWRWGLEGDPGHQGFHGLKEQVSDDFLCLGKPAGGHNETVYREEPGGTRYWLWTTVEVTRRTRVRVQAGGLKPAALYVDGKEVSGATGELVLEAGVHPVLVRYDKPGRGHLVFQDREAGPARERTPLAMRWYDEAGVLPFEVRAPGTRPAGWYRFAAPPGLRGFTGVARGEVEAWIDGQPARVVRGADSGGAPMPAWASTARMFRVESASPVPGVSRVALRVVPEPGARGGAVLPEALRLDCGPGTMRAGDWAEGTVLENYSGGAWYRRDVVLSAGQTRGRVRLNLGDVVATAEVRVNGKSAGVRVAPPWVVDVGPLVREGTNRLEVLVFNTLANHYLTVPTRFRGSLKSGLIGPVRLEVQPVTVLR